MNVAEAVSQVEAAGAAFRLDGEKVRVSYPDDERRKELAGQIALLRAQRAEVAAYLRSRQTDYHDRVESTLKAICRPDYPPGMILWLETADPVLYDRLTCTLPDLISRLWDAHAPLSEFERAVVEWLSAHRKACVFFRSGNR